ncbi:hypothetical protein M0802_003217, partial [Mischocyttarus mexicanus]
IIGETNSKNFFDEHKFDRPLFPTWYKPVNNSNTTNSNDIIYFNKNVNALPRCQDEDFCEDDPNYPREFVKTKLRSVKGIIGFKDILTNETDDLSTRIDLSNTPLCLSQARLFILSLDQLFVFILINETLIYPKTAKSVDGDWLFIAQNGEEFAQAVRIEKCLQNSVPCHIVDKKYNVFCEQTYIYRQLVAIKDDSLKPDIFRFPASCCCNIRNS